VTLPRKSKGYKEIIMKYKTKNQGFSLIEVMIAVLVLSVGILAVAKLQSTLMRSGSDANQRTVATSLAQKKIDDLRAFTHLNSTYTWADALALDDSLPKVEVAYSHISGNADLTTYTETGGLIPPSASIPIGSTGYSLNWTVQDYWHTTPLSDPVTTQPAPAPATSDFKRVTVTVGWNNETGDPQSVALDTLITAYSPALTDLSNNSQHGGGPIKVKYTPGLAPDVIKVSIGGGQYKEASKALPDVSHDGDNTLVTFSAVTFTTDEHGNSTADRIDEYSTVNCNCTFSGTGSGYTPSRFAWDNTKKEIYDKQGILVTKTTATENNNGSGTETLLAHVCTQCCRDHHDSVDSSVKYVAGTAASGNHPHYSSSGVSVTSGNYVEACRLKNIDGIRRTFQDWQLKTATVLPNSYLSDNSPSTQNAYKIYVSDYITNSTRNINLPTSLSGRHLTGVPAGESNQIQIRNIYIDDVEQTGTEYEDCVAGIDITDAPCENINAIAITPFTEINLSKLANWTTATNDGAALAGNTSPCPPSDTSNTITCVSNEAIVDEAVDENNYSRGSAHAGSRSGTERIVAYSNPDNTGITGTSALSSGSFETTELEAIVDANHHSDYISVTVDATQTSLGISGAFNFCGGTGGTSNKQALVSDVTIQVNGNNCTTDSSNYEYTCSILSGTTAVITASGANPTNVPGDIGIVNGPINLTANADKIILCAN